MGQRGRPTVFTKKIGREICDRTVDGESLIQICKSEHLPSERTVRYWIARQAPEHREFLQEYARAKEMGIEHELDEAKEIARQPLIGKRVTIEDNGPGKRKTTTVICDSVERSKLYADMLKWRAIHLQPKKYGMLVRVDAGEKTAGHFHEMMEQIKNQQFVELPIDESE